jgi:hypothetical protein
MTTQSSRTKTYALNGTATWFPAASTLTGTLTSENITVRGTGTAFKTEIKAGDYLVNSSNIARKVHAVESDTLLTLDLHFDSDLSGATCSRVENEVLRHLKVIFITDAGAMKCASQDTAAVVPAGFVWETPDSMGSYKEPQLVDAGAGGATVLETI